MSRLDIVQPRAGRDGKTFYTRIGTAWPLDKGGYRLVFDALPIASLNRDGGIETTALLFPPKDNADRPARQAPARGGAGSEPTWGGEEDDVPFVTSAGMF